MLNMRIQYSRCQTMTENVVDQCACWINSTVYIDKIREEKCQAKSHQKKVTDFKKKCTDVFKACKKMEDKSVESVYYCMDDHSLKFINMTKESLGQWSKGKIIHHLFSL